MGFFCKLSFFLHFILQVLFLFSSYNIFKFLTILYLKFFKHLTLWSTTTKTFFYFYILLVWLTLIICPFCLSLSVLGYILLRKLMYRNTGVFLSCSVRTYYYISFTEIQVFSNPVQLEHINISNVQKYKCFQILYS